MYPFLQPLEHSLPLEPEHLQGRIQEEPLMGSPQQRQQGLPIYLYNIPTLTSTSVRDPGTHSNSLTALHRLGIQI